MSFGFLEVVIFGGKGLEIDTYNPPEIKRLLVENVHQKRIEEEIPTIAIFFEVRFLEGGEVRYWCFSLFDYYQE